MDTTPALQSLASLFPTLPVEAVEDLLVNFDALINVSNDASRQAGIRMLRDAAAASTNATTNERLVQAAQAIETGQPATHTVSNQTITIEQWEKCGGEATLPPPPMEPTDPEDQDEQKAPTFMDREPPKLPHLPVRHFFNGVVVRVARDFSDANHHSVPSGQLLKLLTQETSDDGITLIFVEKTIRLSKSILDHAAVIENHANSRFQPVPTLSCLADLGGAIGTQLSSADEIDDLDDVDLDRIETIREDVEACQDWLASDDRSSKPVGRSAPLAARVFGRDHPLTIWIRLLFDGIAVCKPAG